MGGGSTSWLQQIMHPNTDALRGLHHAAVNIFLKNCSSLLFLPLICWSLPIGMLAQVVVTLRGLHHAAVNIFLKKLLCPIDSAFDLLESSNWHVGSSYCHSGLQDCLFQKL